MSVAPPDEPYSRVTRLVFLVGKLVIYARELAEALRQQGIDALAAYPARFGTGDVALILARIERGLHLAIALNCRLMLHGSLHADPKPRAASARRTPRPPAPPADNAPPRIDTAAPDPRLVALP